MRKRLPARFLSLCLICLLGFPVMNVGAQENKAAKQENKVAGKIYDIDDDRKDTDDRDGLPNVPVRIVEMNTGASYEDTTDKNGCYEIDNVAIGNYSVTVTYKEKEYLYPDKLLIMQTEREKNLFKRCYGLNTDGTLTLMPDKECETCRRFPIAWFVVGAGVAAAIGIGIGRDEEEASPSTP